jgi:hypothetical protein
MEDQQQMTIYIISVIISAIILIFINYWLNTTDKCDCTKNIPEKKYLKEWFTFVIIYLIIQFIIVIASNSIPIVFLIFGLPFGIINLVMYIRLFIYIRKLREIDCKCGSSLKRNIIYYYLIVAFTILAIALFLIIISLIVIATTYFSKPQTQKKIKSISKSK